MVNLTSMMSPHHLQVNLPMHETKNLWFPPLPQKLELPLTTIVGFSNQPSDLTRNPKKSSLGRVVIAT